MIIRNLNVLIFLMFIAITLVATESRADEAYKSGACVLVCEGRTFKCVDDVDQEYCTDENKYEIFGAIPRCPHSIEFHVGLRCEPSVPSQIQ